MLIRRATEEDIPAIIELLKTSLGESLMPKSESFWRWKHIDNTFGPSPVVLALEGDRIAGVRAFMRWEWKRLNQVLRAVRAVDTATHPDFQGKGIFKKLTLQLVEHCKKSNEVDFIFNTPNKKSKPGYLKMGWREVGRLPVVLRPSTYWKKQSHHFDSDFRFTPQRFDELMKSIQSALSGSESPNLRTNLSIRYLRWRYIQCPNIPYFIAHDDAADWFVFFRLKSTRLGTEFRICETVMSSSVNPGLVRLKMKQVISLSGANFVSAGVSAFGKTKVALPVGPVVTVNEIRDDLRLNFENWQPNLGDLEVF